MIVIIIVIVILILIMIIIIQAGPLHQEETLFASQSPWFGLGC